MFEDEYMEPLLSIKELEVRFALRDHSLTAVDKISFDLHRGERLGLVGESGAGKSVTGFSILNLISKPGHIAGGSILFDGKDLTKADESVLRSIRGNRISMIFQDPMMTLNPVLTIGVQMIEALQSHHKISRSDAEAVAIENLRKVHIPSPERRLGQYPHELSGGMRQRVVIATALLAKPDLIIADEPTTALDVTIQAEIMDLLLVLCETEHMGLILITHDLGVVAQVTERVAVMYAGHIVEIGATSEIVANPLHPYTRGLLAALPEGESRENTGKRRRLNQIPGVMPGLASIPSGCPFHPRCDICRDICKTVRPELRPCDSGRLVACHFAK